MKMGLKTHRLQQKALDYYCRGNHKKFLKDYKGAVDDFTKAIKFNPNFAEAYFRRANTKIVLNDTEGAMLDYNKAIELNPDFAETLNKSQLIKLSKENPKVEKLDLVKAG
jgi:tetratricopeptide (TPR) repeat protein